jgi:AAT family amino acid transporter
MAIFWKSGFDRWPWQTATRGVACWSRFFAIFFMVNIIYAVLFHPHVCYLFYPAQTKAGAAPWWGDLAQTTSAFFSLGIVICILFWLIAFDFLWDGMPFKKLVKNGQGAFLKGIAVFVVSVILGMILVYVLTRIMNYFWEEAFMGGQYTDGPDFRYIHTGEISGFFILAAFVLHYYFNNFPNLGNIWLQAIIRTFIAVAGGILFYAFYYSPLATIVLSKVPGVAQPGDTPLVWTFLFVSVIMVHTQFFRAWPLKKDI